MRRVIVICLAVFALVGVGSLALVQLAPESAPVSADQQLGGAADTAPSEPAAPWSGAGVQKLGATFLVADHQIVIREFSFGGLNTRLATVDAKVLVIPSAGRKWITKAFRLNNARVRFAPKKVKVTDTGNGYLVSLRFTGVPSAQLRGKIGFSVTYPVKDPTSSEGPGQQSFSVSPFAPQPPAAAAGEPAPAPAAS